jgi:hypothetical protein
MQLKLGRVARLKTFIIIRKNDILIIGGYYGRNNNDNNYTYFNTCFIIN